MVLPAVKAQILNDLDRLSPAEQRRAATLVHGMLSGPPKGTPGKDLLPFVGTIDSESIREMLAAIHEGCEQVDPDGW